MIKLCQQLSDPPGFCMLPVLPTPDRMAIASAQSFTTARNLRTARLVFDRRPAGLMMTGEPLNVFAATHVHF
jgi:hypothetical protein